MAAYSPDVGHGTTISFGTSTFCQTNGANVLSIDGTDISRESYEISHLGTTTYKQFMPGDLVDPGQTTFEIQFIGQQGAATVTQKVPISQAPELITITFPNLDTFVSYGFITSWSWKVDESVMTATVVIKWTGYTTGGVTTNPTWTNH